MSPLWRDEIAIYLAPRKLALAVTEAGTNVFKHAGSGWIATRLIERDGTRVVEVVAIDKGPGKGALVISQPEVTITGTIRPQHVIGVGAPISGSIEAFAASLDRRIRK